MSPLRLPNLKLFPELSPSLSNRLLLQQLLQQLLMRTTQNPALNSPTLTGLGIDVLAEWDTGKTPKVDNVKGLG